MVGVAVLRCRASESRSKEKAVASETWKVYELRNANFREIYYGVSREPRRRLTTGHCVGDTVALQHWNCDEDEVTGTIVAEHATQREASSHAHALERMAPPMGWTILQTAGV
jgi:predicted GIY-YIG superfamily endonuclease